MDRFWLLKKHKTEVLMAIEVLYKFQQHVDRANDRKTNYDALVYRVVYLNQHNKSMMMEPSLDFPNIYSNMIGIVRVIISIQ